MKEALTYIVKSIVEASDKIVVEEAEHSGLVEFTVHVPQDEIGKVIGKSGKVIRAIRNVLKIAAVKEQKKVTITLREV